MDPDDVNGWRHQVLEISLRITTLLMPVLLIIVLVARVRDPIDGSLWVFWLLLSVIAAVRFLPQLGFRVRAATFVAALQLIALNAIASSGLLPGSGMAALVSVCLCTIFFGRRPTIFVLLFTPLMYLVIGTLVTNGEFHLRVQDADPLVFGHWVRAATVIGSLSLMLGVSIDYVSRQVESGYRSAMEAAGATRTAYEQLGMLHRRLELAKEEERSALARELHDEMGQTLTVLKLHMQLIFRGNANPTAMQQGELIELVDRLISQVRKISLNLRPTMLDELGLEPALAAFIDGQSRPTGPQIALEVSGFSERLAPEIEHGSFCIVQEAVTNTLRHAKAKQVTVHVQREPHTVRIVVADDGSGFSEKEAAAKAARGHLGLVGMRERVRLLGGEMTVGPVGGFTDHPGTCVQVTLPATPPRAP